MPVAVEMLRARKISELPVVDGQNRPVGLIDITDVMSLLPAEKAAPSRSRGTRGPTRKLPRLPSGHRALSEQIGRVVA